ncbi:unnamed protein product, partial [Musa acuminata subsp. burmannicoides]
EAVLKNIEACRQLSVITRKSLGPNGGMLLSTGVIHTSATETKGAILIQNSKPGILFICSL